MEQLDVDHIVGNETAVDEWVREGLDAHGMVIEVQKVVETLLITHDISLTSGLLLE